MKDIVLNENAFYFYNMIIRKTASFDFLDSPRYCYEFYYVKNGHATFETKKQHLTILENEMLFSSPETAYKLTFYPTADDPFEGRCISFRFFPDLNPHDFLPQVIRVDEALAEKLNEVPLHSKEINSAFLHKTYGFTDAVLNYMVKNEEKHSKKIQKALEYMQTHDSYTIPELAQLCNLSESHFYAVFSKATGMTPIKMKHRLQATKAEMLLKTTNLSIEEIAERTGFASTTHFRKVYHSRYRKNPSETRKQFEK